MQIVQFQKAVFDKNKLTISDNITIEEWKELGQSLKQVEGSVQFWIGDWARYGDKRGFTGKYTDPKVYDELEEITGLERQTLKNYKVIAENTEQIRNTIVPTSVSFSHFAEISKLTPEKQGEFLNRVSEEKLSVRDLRNEVRRDERVFNVVEIPNGTYELIYCDPPWRYDFAETDNRKIENQYPTMTVDEICKITLPDIADNALLLMWATAPKLIEALSVIDAWGFTYKTHCVWDKEKIGMGYWFRGQHELLLVATKGSFSPPMPEQRISSVYREARGKHSSKPLFFYDYIDNTFKNKKKIELFARMKINDNWEVWGNEQL